MEELAKVLKAAADPNRLKMLDLLSCGKMCGCDFIEELGLSQPNVSHHLKILKEAGLVTANKNGRWVEYRVNQEKLEWVQEELGQVAAACHKECDIQRMNCEEKILVWEGIGNESDYS